MALATADVLSSGDALLQPCLFLHVQPLLEMRLASLG